VLPEFRFLSWNLDEYKAFRAAVRSGHTALDVGANIGAYSLLLGQWVRPGGHVFSFEPMPAIFNALQKHIQLNGLAETVTPINAAASDSVGTAKLLRGDSAGSSRLSTANDVSETVIGMVPITTLDAFCEERG